MFISNITSGKGIKAAALSALLTLLVAVPYGCSKGEKAQQPQPQGQAAQAQDPAKDHFEKGVQFSLKGQLDDAIKEYEAVLTFNPGSPEAHNNLGFAYFDKGDLDKAVEHQRKSVELNNKFANAYYGLAMALEKKGDKKGAIENWKKFSSLSQPHSKWWMKAEEHIQMLEGRKLGAAKAAKN